MLALSALSLSLAGARAEETTGRRSRGQVRRRSRARLAAGWLADRTGQALFLVIIRAVRHGAVFRTAWSSGQPMSGRSRGGNWGGWGEWRAGLGLPRSPLARRVVGATPGRRWQCARDGVLFFFPRRSQALSYSVIILRTYQSIFRTLPVYSLLRNNLSAVCTQTQAGSVCIMGG